jgi:multimeric flavodoxin WrbA
MATDAQSVARGLKQRANPVLKFETLFIQWPIKKFVKEVSMPKIAAIYGSPRRKGNTATLLKNAVRGACEAGAEVDEIVIRDLNLSPCLEIYACKETGECVMKDDFPNVRERMLSADGIILASPIFFYAVSAHTKILMDRCQSFWVKKYWIDEVLPDGWTPKRRGMFISAGATKGKKLFEGAVLTVKYFFDVLEADLWKTLLYRGLDLQGDVDKHPEYIDEAYTAGKEFGRLIDAA